MAEPRGLLGKQGMVYYKETAEGNKSSHCMCVYMYLGTPRSRATSMGQKSRIGGQSWIELVQ